MPFSKEIKETVMGPTIDKTNNQENYKSVPPANYSVVNLVILCMVGLIIKLCFSEAESIDGETGPAKSTIWGYGIASISVFFMTFINYALSVKSNTSNDYKADSLKFTGKFVGTSLPSVFTLIILIYLIWLNFHYFTNINSGKVADEYYDMSKLSNILLFFQIFTLFKYLHTLNKGKNETNDGAIVYLLSLLNIVFIIILNIILEFFSTDG